MASGNREGNHGNYCFCFCLNVCQILKQQQGSSCFCTPILRLKNMEFWKPSIIRVDSDYGLNSFLNWNDLLHRATLELVLWCLKQGFFFIDCFWTIFPAWTKTKIKMRKMSVFFRVRYVKMSKSCHSPGFWDGLRINLIWINQSTDSQWRGRGEEREERGWRELGKKRPEPEKNRNNHICFISKQIKSQISLLYNFSQSDACVHGQWRSTNGVSAGSPFLSSLPLPGLRVCRLAIVLFCTLNLHQHLKKSIIVLYKYCHIRINSHLYL